MAFDDSSTPRTEITAYVFDTVPRRVTMLEYAVIYTVSTSTELTGAIVVGAITQVYCTTQRTGAAGQCPSPNTHSHLSIRTGCMPYTSCYTVHGGVCSAGRHVDTYTHVSRHKVYSLIDGNIQNLPQTCSLCP